jgi:hypothetical protein
LTFIFVSMFSITASPQDRVEAFHKRFEPLYGEGHLLFACHAVYPVMLTPDLLYQLWYNFRHFVDDDGKAKETAPEVVNDFIHSGLCKPLSQGLYSVEDELRVYLLQKLIALQGEESVHQLAYFLKAWLAQPEAQTLRKSTRQLHEWVIEATLDPGKAAKAVTEALSQNIQQGNRRQNKRIYHVINSLKEHSAAFEELFQYAEKVAEQIQRQEGEDVLLPAISFEEQDGIDLVKMPLTPSLRKKIGRKAQGETAAEVLLRIESAKASGGIEADLSSLSLSPIPPELLELKDLESLSLEDNAFTSSPKGLHQFPKLRRLNLASNQLRYLNINLLDCPELRWLNLDDNELSFIPGHIGQLRHLKHLTAKYNPIRYVPGSMGVLPLEQIHLSDSRLETLPPGWRKLIEYWDQLEREEKAVDFYGGLEEAAIVLDLGANAFGNNDPNASPARQLDFALAYSRGYFDGLNFSGQNRVVAVIAGTDSHLASEIPDIVGTEDECHQWVDWLNFMVPSERLEVRELIGQRACTKRNIIDALMSAEVGEGDQLLFIFTGHGSNHALPEPLRQYYEEGIMSSLVCSDSRAEESDLYGIELEAIFSALQQRGASIVMISDVPYSSALWRLPDSVRTELPEEEVQSFDPKALFFVQGVEDPTLNDFAAFTFGDGQSPAQLSMLHFSSCRKSEQVMMKRFDDKETGVFN